MPSFLYWILTSLAKISLSVMVHGHKQLKNTSVFGGTILTVEVSQGFDDQRCISFNIIKPKN